MATVTGLTKERMLEIEAASIVGGAVVGGDLILTKHDATTINAGSVIGPTGPEGPAGDVSTVDLNAAILAAIPVGVVWDYIETAPPTNWLKMTGQTVTDGETLYPLLWAKIPATMKSGSDIIMPDTRGAVTVGYKTTDTDFDTIGKVGGAKTHTLLRTELPNETLSINPPSTSVSVNPPATTVSVDPPATNTGNQSSSHTHGYVWPDMAIQVQSGTGTTVFDNITYNNTTGTQSSNHYHSVNIPAFDIVVDIAAFNVSVDIGAFDSEALGSGDAHSIMQPYVVFLKMIKAA